MSKINKEKLKESSEEYKEASLLHNLLKSYLQEKEEDWTTDSDSYSRDKKKKKFNESFIIKFEEEDDFLGLETSLEKAIDLQKIVYECLDKLEVWATGPFDFSHNQQRIRCKFTFILADKETRDLIKKNRKITDFAG